MMNTQILMKPETLNNIYRLIQNTAFYQNKYLEQNLSSLTPEQFTMLPIWDSNDFTNMSNNDLYYDQHESNYVFTSINNINEVSYWNLNYLENQISIIIDVLNQFEISPKDRIMNLFVPGISGSFHIFNLALEKAKMTIIPLGGDSELDVIVRFITDLNVNVLIGEPEVIISVISYLVDNHPNINIEKVFIVGNDISKEQDQKLKNYNANFMFPLYFSPLTGIIGIQCNHIQSTTFHLSKTLYGELVDENGNLTNDEGNLVITDLTTRASPLIRYNMGKQVKLIVKKCKCGDESPLFKIIR